MAEVATSPTSDQLLVVIDPAARRRDGESVRIARDVLSGGATTKVCLPEGPEEFARVLARRGSMRPVLVGDDRALVRAVGLLYRRQELTGCALALVPVGGTLSLARSLGVPMGAVAASRAVLEGSERRMNLLVDDSDGVVLGAVRIPPAGATWVRQEVTGDTGGEDSGTGPRPWLRTCQSLVRTLTRPSRLPPAFGDGSVRLRVEVDGAALADPHQPVEAVSVTPGPGGTVRVEVRPVPVGPESVPLLAEGHTVTVSGTHFHYRADSTVSEPVDTRTWVARESAWGLTLPV